MNLSSKIALENKIFAQASRLQSSVHGCGGKLISSSKDVYLQALLNVYNTFFYRENYFQCGAQDNPLEAYQQFLQTGTATTTRTRVFTRSFIELLF